MIYVDRGDPAAPDFGNGDFTKDSNWHELDLSAIVPAAGANKLVYITATVTGDTIEFRKPGNSNAVNTLYINAVESGWVQMDADRKIEYKVVPAAGTIAGFAVRGWMQ